MSNEGTKTEEQERVEPETEEEKYTIDEEVKSIEAERTIRFEQNQEASIEDIIPVDIVQQEESIFIDSFRNTFRDAIRYMTEQDKTIRNLLYENERLQEVATDPELLREAVQDLLEEGILSIDIIINKDGG